MNSIESYLLDSGFSWTLSKLLPYIFTLIIGIVLALIVKRLLKKSSFFLRLGVEILFFIIPFIVYFIYSPIYEADFSNNSTMIVKTSFHKELSGDKLVVLTIPNCPYCFEAIGKMKKLKERVPKIEIEYIVCISDSLNYKNDAQWYIDEADGAISVSSAQDSKMMSELADHAFPTFILVEDEKPLKKWNNNDFGVVALDEIELHFK